MRPVEFRSILEDMHLLDLQTGKSLPISDKGAVIGKAGAAAVDVPIDASRVADHHAKITLQQGRWFIEDLDTEAGVLIGGQRIKGPQELRAGMRIVIIDHELEVVMPAEVELAAALFSDTEPLRASAPEAAAPLQNIDDVSASSTTPSPSSLARLSALPEPVKLGIGGASGLFLIMAIAFAAMHAPRRPKPEAAEPSKLVASVTVAPQPASAPVTEPADARVLPYQEYRNKRDTIERVIADNPLILRDEGILSLYDRLHVETQKAEALAKKKSKKRPRAIEERVRDAEVFERTHALVDALHRELSP
jgi:predicted component of type VI protein secretion system